MSKKPTYADLEQQVRELQKTVAEQKRSGRLIPRREAESSLRLTQFCFDSAAIGIYHIQSDGRILNVNAHAANMLGYTVEELSGLYIWDIDPFVRPDNFGDGWDRLVSAGVETFESDSVKKDGSRIHVEITANLLAYDGRQFIISFVNDVTERKRTRESLKITQFSFDNANIGIYRIAPNGQVMEVNQEAARLLGYSKEELEKLPIMDIDPSVTQESWTLACRRLSTEGSYAHERKHRRKDGRHIPVETYARCLEYEGKQYVIAFVQEISKRKQAEEALKENEQLLNNIVESMNEGLFVLDSNYKCTIFNRALEQMVEHSKGETLGKAPWETFPKLKGTPVEKNIQKTMDGQTTGNLEFPINLPTGRVAWFRDSFSPLKDDAGNVIGVVAVVTDITQQKQIEDEKEKLLHELQEALENVRMLSGMLPICSSCKKIRDDNGYWKQIESYIRDHSEAEFSHGICPDCFNKLYPGFRRPSE